MLRFRLLFFVGGRIGWLCSDFVKGAFQGNVGGGDLGVCILGCLRL